MLRVLRNFTELPKYLKREANRRRAADSGQIVAKAEVIQEPSAPHGQETAFEEMRRQATLVETLLPTSRLLGS